MWRVSSVLTLSGLSTPPVRMSSESRVRGLAVHIACEAIAAGYAPADVSAYAGYIDGLQEFFHTFSPTVVATERRIVNRLRRLTGRIDLFVMVDGIAYVVDVKTGQKACWHGLQTAGYKELAIDDQDLFETFVVSGMTHARAEIQRAILYLPGNGTAEWVVQRDPQDRYRFCSALALLCWRYDNGMLALTDPEVPDDDVRVTQSFPEHAF